MDRFPYALIGETFAALMRNLDELHRLEAKGALDPEAIASLQDARSLLIRANGLVLKLADRR